MTRLLSPDEEALAGLVERAGLSVRAARCFVALARGGGWSASELAGAAAIARQDVSEGARELEARGLARVERVASGGRPSHRYHLAADPAAAVRALTSARRDALAREREALDALDARFGVR